MSGNRVRFLGDAMAAVVQGVQEVRNLIGQPPVVISGLAVMCRLSSPYRATTDLDLVDRLLGQVPQLQVLRAARDAEPVEPAAVLLPTPYGQVKVDVLEVRQIEIDRPSDDPGDRLHASAHAWANDTGAAADIAGWGDVEVLAHHADAPFIRARAAGPPPDLADWERPLYDQVTTPLPNSSAPEPPTPPRIDRELGDGDQLGFGDGAVAVAVPGHTPGSVAIYLPRHQVLFAGDAAARRPDGAVMCGVFNVDRAQAAASFRRLGGLDVAVACFGHGDPLTGHATAALRAAAERLPTG